MKSVLSGRVRTAPAIGRVKLGQPVPLSNLSCERNTGRLQPAQRKLPRRCSALSGLLPERSVPCWRSTRNCSALRRRRHCSAGRLTSNVSADASEPRPSRTAPTAAIAAAPAPPRKVRLLILIVPPRSVAGPIRSDERRGYTAEPRDANHSVPGSWLACCCSRRSPTKAPPPPPLAASVPALHHKLRSAAARSFLDTGDG